MKLEAFEKKNRLYLGSDAHIHLVEHGTCQLIAIDLPLSAVLALRCDACGADRGGAAEYERRQKMYQTAEQRLQADKSGADASPENQPSN